MNSSEILNLASSNTSSTATMLNPTMRIFGASSYLVLCLIGISLNLLLLAVLIKGHKQFKTMSFFLLSWQLLINDLMSLFVQTTLAVPISFAGGRIYPEGLVIAIATLDTIAYYGLLIFALVLTLNRLAVFVSPYVSEKFFSTPNIFWIIGGTWAFNLIYCAIINVGSWKSYNSDEFYITYLYRDLPDGSFIKSVYTVVAISQDLASTYLPVIMLGIYVFIFLEIKFNIIYMIRHFERSDTGIKQSKREIYMLIQSGLVCLAIELENLSFTILPSLIPQEGDLAQLTSICLTWSNLFLNTVHSLVIFMFNSMAKEKAKEILCCKKNSAVERFKAGSTMVSAIAAALPRRASTVADIEVPASRMYNTQPKLSIASIIFARK